MKKHKQSKSNHFHTLTEHISEEFLDWDHRLRYEMVAKLRRMISNIRYELACSLRYNEKA